jgi:hypothetical protein
MKVWEVKMDGNHLCICGDLSDWEVTLLDGTVIRLRAHGYEKEEEFCIFSILMHGSPRFEVEVARFPRVVIDKVRGGWKKSEGWQLDWLAGQFESGWEED